MIKFVIGIMVGVHFSDQIIEHIYEPVLTKLRLL